MKKLILYTLTLFVTCSLTAAPVNTRKCSFSLPLVNTHQASGIIASGAVLHVTVDDNGSATSVVIEYGQTADLSDAIVAASDTGVDTVSAGSGPTAFSATITSLNASTRYYYRIRAANNDGAVSGTIEFFTTLPPPPVITTFYPASGPVGTLVTVTGNYFDNLSSISIGDKTAIVVSASASQLVAMVMPGATTGNISLATSGGTATGAGGFTVAATLYPAGQQGSKLLDNEYGPAISQRGSAVAISADGNTAIVGAPIDGANRIGCAWIFVRRAGTWVQQGSKLVGGGYNTGTIGTGGSYQGAAVSISADGNTAMVGGYVDSAGVGAVWIFVRADTTWSQQGQKLVAGDAAGAARFGSSVSLSANGNTAIVGGWGDNSDNGAVWIFTRSSGVWTQHGNKLTGTDNLYAAQMGYSVAMSADGSTAVAGGWRDNGGFGAVWVFVKSGGGWQQQGDKMLGTGYGTIGTPQQGVSVAINADGNTIAAGGYGDYNPAGGAVWIYVRNNGTWSQQGPKLVGTNNVANSFQGYSVALSADGNTLAEGGTEYMSSSLGGVWIFTRNGSTWTQQGNKLRGGGAVDGSKKSNQGYAVALSADGGTVIEGGYTDNSDRGAVWVFTSGLPADTTLAATAITDSSAVLHGAVRDNGTATSVIFEYSTVSDLSGATIAVLSSGSSPIIAGTGNVSFSSYLTGLSPATTYYFRIGGRNNNGETYGPVLSFTTTGQPAPSIISFSPAFGPVGTLITVTGTHLLHPSTFHIGGVAAVIVSGSDTQLVAMVMPGAINGPVSITTPGGIVSANEGFTVTPTQYPNAQIGSKLVGTGSPGYAHQGASVAISADGNTAAVGGDLDAGADQGAVWIFVRNNGVWQQQGSKLTCSGSVGSGGPHLGNSVAISADGKTAVVGGYWDYGGNGALWIYTQNGGIWTQQGNKLVASLVYSPIQFGQSVAVNANGTTIAAGGIGEAPDVKGAVWVYVKNGGNWVFQSKVSGTTSYNYTYQGYAVALSADGNTLMEGGPNYLNANNGGIWVFTRSGASWTQRAGQLQGAGAIAGSVGSSQGWSVSLNATGEVGIEGGPADNTHIGASWVFGNKSAIVVTKAATDITASEAVLHGSIRNNNSATTVTLQYGTNANLAGATTATLTTGISPVPAGAGSASFSSNVTGLAPSTTYYFRIRGVASGTTVNGAILSFTTEADSVAARLFVSNAVIGKLPDTTDYAYRTGKKEVTFYPNPVTNKTGMLHFNQIPHGGYTLVVTDAAGRSIFKRDIVYAGADIPVSFAGRRAGLYLLKISLATYNKVFKLLVE